MESEALTLGNFAIGHILLMSSSNIGGSIFVLIILLISSAMISGSEVAFFSLNANDVDSLKSDDSAASKRILQLRLKPRLLLATILICNNLINIAIVLFSAFILDHSLAESAYEVWAKWLLTIFHQENADPTQLANIIGFLITVVGVTFLLVLFGEVAPKIYARLNNIRLAKIMSRPLQILQRIFWPISQLLVNWSSHIERRLNEKYDSSSNKEDIDSAIELTIQTEEKDSQEADMLKGILKFNEVNVKQVMKSRVDVVAVDYETTFKELMILIRTTGFSRIPVYKEDFDNVVGLLYVKDLLAHIHEENVNWQDLIRTNILYVPEFKKINELLRDFQKERMHMAIVVDEFGGSSGIATLEDIMEEVVGEIKDEFDQDEPVDYVQIDDHNFIFEGKTMLNDVIRIVGTKAQVFEDIKGDADSLAGLFLELTRKIPRQHQEVNLRHIKLKVMAVTKRRIERIQLTLLS